MFIAALIVFFGFLALILPDFAFFFYAFAHVSSFFLVFSLYHNIDSSHNTIIALEIRHY